jgi:hypothetical protein
MFSVFAATSAFISTVELIYYGLPMLPAFLQRLPMSVWVEVVYLATGTERELGHPVQESVLPVFQHASQVPEANLTVQVQSGGTDEGPSREFTVLFPEVPSPTYNPHKLPPKERKRLGGGTPRLSPSSTSLEQEHPTQHAPSADVPLTVVKDIVLALSQNETTIRSLEPICDVHRPGPPVGESATGAVREKPAPGFEWSR